LDGSNNCTLGGLHVWPRIRAASVVTTHEEESLAGNMVEFDCEGAGVRQGANLADQFEPFKSPLHPSISHRKIDCCVRFASPPMAIALHTVEIFCSMGRPTFSGRLHPSALTARDRRSLHGAVCSPIGGDRSLQLVNELQSLPALRKDEAHASPANDRLDSGEGVARV
jgi:hypothetical protein